jgi:hypothetical protein
MKHFQALIIAASIIATTTASAAAWKGAASPRTNLHDLSSVIVTVHMFSDHPYSAEYIEADYIGSSASAPCSDLKSVTQPVSPDLYGNFNDDTFKLSSQQLVDEYGSALTCIKTTFTMRNSHNVYSTGNILLLWDEHSNTYTAATPNKIAIDLSKG